jgi:uncharacterized membrane protein
MTRGAVVRRWGLGLAFVAAGVNHFANPDFYARIMPPYLPWHRELVALLAAVFPANVHMALHPDEYPPLPPWLLYARLPLQGVFAWWAYRWTRPAGGR